MRVLRAVIVVMVALGGLLLASPAYAQVDQISMGEPILGLEGASVVVPVSVVCDLGWNIAFGDVSLAQAHSYRLTVGFGGFSNSFPGVPCTHKPQSLGRIRVNDSGPWTFTLGHAAATVDVTVFNPTTGALVTKTVGPRSVTIRRK